MPIKMPKKECIVRVKRQAVARKVEPIVRRDGWAIWSKTGHVCVNAEGMPAVFFYRKQAVQFRDELIPHIGKGKVFRAVLVVSSNPTVEGRTAKGQQA
jgi:hypothetical protein